MILKCKMCGGDLVLNGEKTIIECEYCGTQQTIPNTDNEKKTNLFNRANRLRMSAEFDKAAGVYESIVAEFPEEAEAYWGLCLCAYGIEYVDDPATGKKIPTCHRTSAESIMDSSNFEMACEYADVVAKRLYRSEAREIDRLQKDILSIVSNESPYDVFICYKETGEDGGRTEDSVIAQDIYDALRAKNMKVFFARITLEDKIGQQYEPYIYAALHSSKVMLAIGTCFEHFDAVWVKNEWSRFLDMMKEDRTKVLVPCYKGLDVYDIPKEMRALQAQDMGKLGFMQDLVRGVEKIVGKMPAAQSVQPVQQVVQQTVVQQGASVDSLMERAMLFLEDGDFKSAKEYLDRVLDINPKHAPAYFAKVMAKYGVRTEKQMSASDQVRDSAFETEPDWHKALRFADAAQENAYKALFDQIQQRRALRDMQKQKEHTDRIFNEGRKQFGEAKTVEDYKNVSKFLLKIKDDSRAQSLMQVCEERIEALWEVAYEQAVNTMNTAVQIGDWQKAQRQFEAIMDYRDSVQMIEVCQAKAAECEAALEEKHKQEAARREQQRIIDERNWQIAAAKAKKRNIRIAVCLILAALMVAAYVLMIRPAVNNIKLDNAISEGDYAQAYQLLHKRHDSDTVGLALHLDGGGLLGEVHVFGEHGEIRVGAYIDGDGTILDITPYYHERGRSDADRIAEEEITCSLIGQNITTAKIDPKYREAKSFLAINRTLDNFVEYGLLKESGAAADQSESKAVETNRIESNVYNVTGFAPMRVEIRLDMYGTIQSVKVLEHNETPYFGADLIKEGFDALVGQHIADAQIDVKSGVTLTSNAINQALRDAAKANGFDVKETDDQITREKQNSSVIGMGTTNRSINIRENPHAEAKILRQATKGTKLFLLGKETAADGKIWYRVSDMINGEIGYARDYVLNVSEGSVYEVHGFQPMQVEVNLDDMGKIVSVGVLKHNETPGFGADLISADFDALVGQNIANAQIDVKAGVTLTSNGINEVLRQAAEKYQKK